MMTIVDANNDGIRNWDDVTNGFVTRGSLLENDMVEDLAS